ncbi:MAG: long-chain fatty acid--CoA ligase [Solirubrobacteraceae bacterium]|nr:long-chain fatty acid--CoA ligase [Solirubrobacteraceae bacterium]
MEAGTTPTTDSKTIADLIPKAAQMYAGKTAARHKVDGEWVDVSFEELGGIVSEVGRGLIAMGLEPGERVSILCSTRPEWVYGSFAVSSAGGVVVPIYATNSPEECEWVAGNSESAAIIVENAEQYAKIAEVRDRLPELRFVVVIDPSGETGDAISLEELREKGRGVDESELAARTEAVTLEDPYTFIYTSGTTGPPKGCVLSHGNYRSILDSINQRGLFAEGEDVVYLFLPLAHAFALLISLGAADTGTAIAYWSGDPQLIIPDLAEVKPTYLPSVPRIFEKLYSLVAGNVDPEVLAKATEVGEQVRDLQVAGEPVPEELQAAFDQFDEQLFTNVRAAFGGRVREAVTGAAPIAPEILRFFYAAGVPVMEGYGMTETATVATTSTPEAHKFGSIGKPLPGVEVKIADDGEILVRGANIFQGYYKNDDASFGAIVDGWLHTGDLGSIDEDGFVYITGRKKDIIITAGGKNLTPANLENDMKQSQWVSQAVMHGDRRPFPVMLITLDPETIVPWAEAEGIEDTSIEALSKNEQVIAMIQAELDRANEKYAGVEQVKKFFILEHDLSQETDELTPTLKVKRNVVNEKYADRFDALYES